jgi:hypothetical protein
LFDICLYCLEIIIFIFNFLLNFNVIKVFFNFILIIYPQNNFILYFYYLFNQNYLPKFNVMDNLYFFFSYKYSYLFNKFIINFMIINDFIFFLLMKYFYMLLQILLSSFNFIMYTHLILLSVNL